MHCWRHSGSLLTAALVALLVLVTGPALAQGDEGGGKNSGFTGDMSRFDKELRAFVKRIRRSVVSLRAYETVINESEEPAAEEAEGDDLAQPGTAVIHEKVTLLHTSGMIRDREGLVMTVLPDGIPLNERGEQAEVEVTLFDGTTLDASWRWCDTETGVTLLQIAGDLPKLHPVRFPNKRLKKGESVVALGRTPGSFSLGPVLSLYVAARGADFSFPRTIHARVAVRNGDAGGMLADMGGVVVGMLAYAPSAFFSLPPDQTSQAFAIPVDLLERICQQLQKKGHVTRGSIGALCQFVPRNVMQTVGRTGVGAQVLQVDPAGSGAAGGLQRGDLILAANNKHFWKMEDLYAFQEKIEYGDIGSQLRLKVFRGNENGTASYHILHVDISERVEFSAANVGIRPADEDDEEGAGDAPSGEAGEPSGQEEADAAPPSQPQDASEG